MNLKNRGKTPASQVLTNYYITTDVDQQNMHGKKWFEQNLGGFPSISFIAPDAEAREPGRRSLSPSATYYYFEALVEYGSLSYPKKYWTHIKKLFLIDRENRTLYLVWSDGDWDKNTQFTSPELSSREKVVALLEDTKKKVGQGK